MIICSWPGSLPNNPFPRILADGFRSVSSTLVPVDAPSKGLVREAEGLLVQWPEQIFWRSRAGKIPLASAMRELDALKSWRWAGKRLVWVVHNLEPHDITPNQLRFWRTYSETLSQLVHGYMTLSEATQDAVLKAHPRLKSLPFGHFPHPAYPYVQRALSVAFARRKALGIAQDETVLGFIGLVADYKGISELIQAFQQITRNKLRLLIVGRRKAAKVEQELRRCASNDNRILIDLRSLTDDEYAETVAACDFLVAPYRSSLHSGTLLYAASAHRRILTPATAFALDISKSVGPGWLHCYRGKINRNVLDDFLASPQPRRTPQISKFASSIAAQRIIDFIANL